MLVPIYSWVNSSNQDKVSCLRTHTTEWAQTHDLEFSRRVLQTFCYSSKLHTEHSLSLTCIWCYNTDNKTLAVSSPADTRDFIIPWQGWFYFLQTWYNSYLLLTCIWCYNTDNKTLAVSSPADTRDLIIPWQRWFYLLQTWYNSYLLLTCIWCYYTNNKTLAVPSPADTRDLIIPWQGWFYLLRKQTMAFPQHVNWIYGKLLSLSHGMLTATDTWSRPIWGLHIF